MGFLRTEARVIHDDTHRVMAAVEAKLPGVVAKRAHKIANDARGRAAKATGSMAASIYVVTAEENGYGDAVAAALELNPHAKIVGAIPQPHGRGEGGVGVAVGHGIFIERGTVHMAAQPFMRPAVEANRGGFGHDLADMLRSVVGR